MVEGNGQTDFWFYLITTAKGDHRSKVPAGMSHPDLCYTGWNSLPLEVIECEILAYLEFDDLVLCGLVNKALSSFWKKLCRVFPSRLLNDTTVHQLFCSDMSSGISSRSI